MFKTLLLVVLLLLCIATVSATHGTATIGVTSPTGIPVGTGSDVVINITHNIDVDTDDNPGILTMEFQLAWDDSVANWTSRVGPTNLLTNWSKNNAALPGTVTFSYVTHNKIKMQWTSGPLAWGTNVWLVNLTNFTALSNGASTNLNFTNVLLTDMTGVQIDSTTGNLIQINGTFTTYSTPPPVASFSKSISNIRTTTGSVTYTYTGSTVPPAYWNWTFGDGTVANMTASTAQTRSYASAGAKAVRLDVANAGGSANAIDAVTVYDSPIPAFTASPTSVGTGVNVTFDSTSSSAWVTGWSWDFGDTTTSPLQNPMHSYATSGLKTISLTVSDPAGTNSTAVTHTVNVIQGPTAAFTANVSAVRTNGWVKFTDASINSPEVWNWSFGDGQWDNSTSSSNPEHQYTANGTYIASLRVNNTVGTDTKTTTINVYNQPLGDFTGTPTTVMTGATVTFNGTTTGFVSVWSWNFGAGASPASSLNRNQTVTYSTGGLKTVTLTRSNPLESNITTKVDYITVTIPTTPIPRITSNVVTGNVPFTVTFSSATSDALADIPLTYLWTFGDGTTSAAALPPAHPYNIAGSYDVSLSITNASGTNTSTRLGYITANAVIIPIVNATVTDATITGYGFSVNTTANTVNYTNTSNTITMTNVTGFSQVIVTMTGNVNTVGGNLTGNVSIVQYFVNPINAFVEGQPISAGAFITESAWNTSGFTFSFTMTDAASNTVYIGLLPSGSTGYDPLAVLNITTSGPVTRAIINISVPLTWYYNYTNAGPTTAGQNFTLVMWTHGTPPVTEKLTPGWGPIDGTSRWLTVDTTGFSMFAVIGAAAAPAPGPAPAPAPAGGGGGGGGGGAYSGQYFTKTAKMLESDEGKVLDTYTINTGQQASFTVPLGTTVLGKDGKPLSTVTVQMTKPADVPAVPAGAVYTFGGYAVTCSPDGATFSPPASLKFFLTNEEWDTLLAKANGRVGYLTVMFYNTATGDWASVPTTVDPVAHSVTGSVSHFSTYGLFIDTSAVTPVVIEATPTITKVPTTAPAVAPVKTTAAPPAPAGEIPWTMIIGVIVLIVIIAGVGYYFITKKQ